MKRSSAFSCAAIFAIAGLLLLPFSSLVAQSNFVKYVGNPVLPLGSPGTWDDTEAAYAHVSFDGTTHHLWYSGGPQLNTYRIGYAASPDGINWNKHANNPVLSISASGGFDNVDAWLPMVLFDGSGYQMWYTGNTSATGIGYATAADPVSWTKHAGNPVITRGGSGAWDQSHAFNPVVIRSDTLYHMWYSGLSASGLWQTGYATSTGGLSWSKYPDNPVLPAGAAGEWDATATVVGSVIFADGQFHMWFHGTAGNAFSGWQIGYATSSDGVNWTKHPGNPIMQPGSGSWDGDNVGFPRIIRDGHRYRMWYTGRASVGGDRLGYAEDFSNAAHVDRIQASPQSVAAGSGTILIEAYIADPHSENLTARALIVSDDGRVNETVDLTKADNGVWWAEWEIPDEVRDYSVGVELNNISAGYVHKSLDWGVSGEFRSTILTHTFAQTGNMHDGGEAFAVDSAADGTPFLANGDDGLRAYTFDGTSFTSIADMDDGGVAKGLAVDEDGLVFLANGDGGLRMYIYDGASLGSLAQIDNGGDARSVALSPSGIIFLANGDDGLRAYVSDVTSITNTAHIDNGGSATDIAVGADGTVFLANGDDGLRAYTYNGASFTNTAHVDDGTYSDSEVAVAADGTVFLANGDGRLRAYSYDGASLTLIAQINTRDWPQGLAVADDGTIFLACRGSVVSPGNLYAYTFDGTSFTLTAQLPAGLTSRDVTAAADGMVFVANGERGLVAYTYTPNVPTSVTDATASPPSRYELLQNYPNPFNPATTIEFVLPQSGFVTLKVYNILGEEVATLLQGHKPAGRQAVRFDASNLPTGIYYYTLTAGGFKQSRKLVLMR